MFEFDNGLAKNLSTGFALSIVILTPVGFLGPRALLTSRLEAVASLIIHSQEINGGKSRKLHFYYHLSFPGGRRNERAELLDSKEKYLPAS